MTDLHPNKPNEVVVYQRGGLHQIRSWCGFTVIEFYCDDPDSDHLLQLAQLGVLSFDASAHLYTLTLDPTRWIIEHHEGHLEFHPTPGS